MRPTFLSFQTAARALAASQAALDVTGNNISNVNTTGYSRQRVDLNAIASSGYTERFSTSRASVDSGVEVAGISQIRDPFLDARYRKENAENSKYDTLLSGLSDLEGVIDEASVDKLQNEFTNFTSQLQALYQDATSQDLALVTRTAAQKITEIFNSYASQVDEIRSQEISDLTDVVVAKDFNSIVQNIASLNKQIRTEELYGNKPNDLYDARNNLLDELSGIANIKVTTSPEKVSDSQTIERLTVSLYDANTGTSIGLVDADSYNTLSVNSDGSPLTISPAQLLYAEQHSGERGSGGHYQIFYRRVHQRLSGTHQRKRSLCGYGCGREQLPRNSLLYKRAGHFRVKICRCVQ